LAEIRKNICREWPKIWKTKMRTFVGIGLLLLAGVSTAYAHDVHNMMHNITKMPKAKLLRMLMVYQQKWHGKRTGVKRTLVRNPKMSAYDP
jgi:hypothetical protein